MDKKYIAVFWGGADYGGLFSNSTTPFSITSAAHAVELRHCRGDLTLSRIVLGGRNEATNPNRAKEAKAWILMQNPDIGDVIQVIDVNQKLRYGLILCVGEKRGFYDN